MTLGERLLCAGKAKETRRALYNRLDGREAYDYRKIKLQFGVDRGCCSVQLGNTKVMAQVSCEVSTPKQTRPTDGGLFINVELGPMAAPQFEAGRQSDEGVELTRLLERCLKESRCIDTESLCIVAGVKVWTIRVDVHVLNHDGNLIDVSSIAAITALAHFRRPDVTVCGEDVTIHTLDEKDPIPLSVHHMPICVTFAFFEQGKFLLLDPIDKEERVMEGKMVIAMNKHREICALQMTGSMLLLKSQVLRCSNIAMMKVKEITELIYKALDNDASARDPRRKLGLPVSLDKKPSQTTKSKTSFKIAAETNIQSESDDDGIDSSMEEEMITGDEAGSEKMIGEGGVNTYSSVDEESEEESAWQPGKSRTTDRKDKSVISHETIGDSSEEDETLTLDNLEIGYKKK